jgi:Tol biopolymer transport system component
MSSDGRFVVFTSRATDLVAEDTNANFDVYLRDTRTGTTRLVSVATGGGATPAAGNADSTDPSVSDDGRFVAFTSAANNLVAGDNNNRTDVFVRDLFTNETRLVSANLTNTGPGNGNSLQAAISDDGRFVAFTSEATNVASNDVTPTRDVFLRNLTNSTTSLVSASLDGTGGGDLPSQSPFVSADGRFVAFVSEATTLEGGGGAAGPDVYLRSIEAASTTLVSTTFGFNGGLADVGTGAPTVSDDGRFVAFSSAAPDLVLGDVNGVGDVFRKDLSTGTVELVSQSTGGVPGNGASVRPRSAPTAASSPSAAPPATSPPPTPAPAPTCSSATSTATSPSSSASTARAPAARQLLPARHQRRRHARRLRQRGDQRRRRGHRQRQQRVPRHHPDRRQ